MFQLLNLDLCDQLENNYKAVILRFFEGDVPTVFAHGDLRKGGTENFPVPFFFCCLQFKPLF